MLVQKLRSYLLYNIPPTDHINLDNDGFTLCMSSGTVEQLRTRFQVQEIQAPAFYTLHYSTQHTPYHVWDPALPGDTIIPCARLADIPFFAELNLTQDIHVSWEMSVALRGIGLVTLCLECEQELPSVLAYRIAGLYLNPDYAVIDTQPLAQLWSLEGLGERPDYISPDDLARAIHAYFFTAAGLPVHRHRALRHEIQIPFTAIEVTTEYRSQPEFLEKEAYDLAELVFRPACWEVGRSSRLHAQTALAASRVWSVSKDALVISSYEGVVYIKISNFAVEAPHEVSGFYLTSEPSILHTFKVASSGYHFLRILDDLLDSEMQRLVDEVHRCQHALIENIDDQDVMQRLDYLSIQITYLRFQLLDLLEEISNSDKLIDEEYHILLMNKINAALNTQAWFDGLNRRLDSLRELVETIEGDYERLAGLKNSRQLTAFNAQMVQINVDNQKLEKRLSRAQPFFEALAAVEALNLLIYIWFDPDFSMVRTLSAGLHWPVGLAIRLIATLLVTAALFLIIEAIHVTSTRLISERRDQS